MHKHGQCRPGIVFFLVVLVCWFCSTDKSLAEEFDSSLELEHDNAVYSQRATPDGPLYFFKRKGDVVYLVHEGKEIMLAETGDSPRAPTCPYLWLGDANNNGLPDIFLREGGGSIGDIYSIFDISGKNITRDLFRTPDRDLFIDGHGLVFPSLQPEKKT